VISDTEEDPERESRHIQLLLTRKVDGLIVASAQTGTRRPLTALAAAKAPFVLIDRKPAGVDAHFIGVKDETVGMLATEHLISQGCKRVAHIQGPETPTGTGRLRGYRKALAKHKREIVPEYLTPGEFSDDAGYQAMQKLLSLDHPPDGVFCYNDPVAAGAIKAALERGLDVPRDVAIIGAGNVHYSDLLRVPLSTVDQSSYMMGEKAADLLIQCMESKVPLNTQEILIEPRLILRQSSLRH
jgi:LacI family transcriptional regulator